MFDFVWNDALKIALFSAVSVVALFLIAKITGKKQIAELNFIDYVMGISIGSIAAQMATDLTATPIWYYLIALLVYLLIAVVVGFLEGKSPPLKRFLQGKPATLIYDGKILYDQLKSNHLTVNDLLSMCRVLGYFDVKDIAYAVLETSGDLSVLPKGNRAPATVGDLQNPKVTQSSLPCYLVIDGRISYSSLTEIGKDERWLMSKLNCQDFRQLKQFILVEYDTETKQVTIHQK